LALSLSLSLSLSLFLSFFLSLAFFLSLSVQTDGGILGESRALAAREMEEEEARKHAEAAAAAALKSAQDKVYICGLYLYNL